MSYVANADIEERLGSAVYVQLTDDTGSGSADEDKVTEARLGAEGEVNSYLGRRYAVPIDVAVHPELSAVLKSVTLDLAEYRLRSRRPPVTEDIRRRRDATVRWLRRAAAGAVVLPTVTEVPGNQALGVAGEVSGAPRVITRDEMEDL